VPSHDLFPIALESGPSTPLTRLFCPNKRVPFSDDLFSRPSPSFSSARDYPLRRIPPSASFLCNLFHRHYTITSSTAPHSPSPTGPFTLRSPISTLDYSNIDSRHSWDYCTSLLNPFLASIGPLFSLNSSSSTPSQITRRLRAILTSNLSSSSRDSRN
jgi:hypothetical protein